MSNLHKSNWSVKGDSMSLSIPFAKVDQERRLVSGFATLDNLDSQKDVVLAEASVRAFERARGNLREMHQPIAAGHLVDFQEDSFFDQESGNLYRGIFVTAYVSRGAESTWEKVLDGTLTGFSIGGDIRDSTTEYVEDAQTAVRFIKDYDLVELSLVDNPANPLANVFSIQKSADGSVTKVNGMVADTSVENVFYCNEDKVARTADADSANCLMCGETMMNIGWVETGAEAAEKVRQVVINYVNGTAVSKSADSEGGVTVTEENKNEEVEGQEVAGVDEGNVESQESVAESDQGSVGEEASGESVEGQEVAGIDEVSTESDEIQKKMDALMGTITESLEKSRDEQKVFVSALEGKIDEFKKSVDSKISEFGDKLTELDKGLAAAKGAVSDVEKSLDKFNSAGAIKKSGEVEKTEPEKVQKDDDWNGAFSVQKLFG